MMSEKGGKNEAMKIVFVVRAFPALSETTVLKQIVGLLELGHDIRLVSIERSGEKVLHPEIERHKILERVRYVDMPRNRAWRVLKAAGLFLLQVWRSPKMVLNTLNVRKFGRWAYSLELFYLLLAFLGDQPDVIHCQFGDVGALAVNLKEVGLKAGLITSFRGFDITGFVKVVGKEYFAKLFRDGDLFLPVSNYFRERLISFGCDNGKIIVHHTGVDVRRFRPWEGGAEARERRERVRILSVGRLTEKKGHKYGLRAVARVVEAGHDVEYVIGGEGDQRESLEELARELGLGGRARFLEAPRSDEVVKLLGEADIFLLPCVTAKDGDQEGIPGVLMEAAAAALPIVATVHSGIPEIVEDGRSGFLAAERDVDGLTAALIKLVESPALRSEMGEAGREIVEREFDIEKLNRRAERIYRLVSEERWGELEELRKKVLAEVGVVEGSK